MPNRTIFCHDNLEILQGINSECIDLIYLDPPFNKKKIFTAPIGSSAEGASFKDIFTLEDIKDEWVQTIQEDQYAIYRLLEAVKDIEGRTSYNFCYLAYMAMRLIECHRVLKDTGSIYLHCDPTMSHYLKLLMDCIFGEKQFRNEITWRRTYSHNDPNRFGRISDKIFFYSKGADYRYEAQKIAYSDEYIRKQFSSADERGVYQSVILTGQGVNPNDPDWRGYNPAQSRRHWSVPQRILKALVGEKNIDTLSITQKLNLLDTHNYILVSKNNIPRFKQYLHEMDGVPCQDIWTDIPPAGKNEQTGYPTQKPLALLERIIKASSKKDDVVLDPFCGCATTCVAAEKLERHWIGIDISIKAYDLVKDRLKKEVANPEELFDYDKAINFQTDPPQRTDGGRHSADAKYVYIISNPQYKNMYKVGIASNWKSRLTSYQTSDPHRAYKMEYKIRVSNYRELESHIHKTFGSIYEWVGGRLEDIIAEIKANAVTHSDEGEFF